MGVTLGLFLNAFFLYDEGTTHLYFERSDDGWLCLMLIPVELCVMMVFILKMIRYLSL
jgi:hypothetical protein